MNGSPEAEVPGGDESAIDGDITDAPPETEPIEAAVSLVIPTLLTISTLATASADPCNLIDSTWDAVQIWPLVERTWRDPLTGLGGGLQLDDTSDAPLFGWDAFGGGEVEGVVVPDAADAIETPAHFYDYRPYLGAVSSDAGLTAPGGSLSIAYLCVQAAPDQVATVAIAPPVPTFELPTQTISNAESSGSPLAAAPDVDVEPAAIDIGSTLLVTEPLNLRVGPGLNATVRAVLDTGTIVTVTGGPQSASGYTWWELSTPNGTGWSVVDFLVEQPVTVTPPSIATATRTPTHTPTTNASSSIAIGSTVRVRQRLNLRSLPGLAADVVTIMSVDTRGTVFGGPQNANGYQWWQIRTTLGEGWAVGSYLDVVSGTPIPPATSTPIRTMTSTPKPSNTATSTVVDSGAIRIGDLVRVNARLNLRVAPGTGADVITVLPSGTQWVVVDGPQSAAGYTWWKLDTTGGEGWVAATYLARVGVAPTATVTRTPASSATVTRTLTPSRTPSTTSIPTITATPGSCGSFGYGDIVRATNSVNLRSQPSTSSTIIRTLAVEERGSVKGGPTSANGYTWCQIQVGSATGWVASLYLARVSGPLPTPNGTVTPRPSPPPPSGGSASVIERGSSNSGMIALTYDAGGDRGYAAYILDVLAEYGAHATFGMTGTWARDNPDLVQRMVNEGHQLINHTWDHPSFTGGSSSTTVLTRTGRLDQLDRVETLVEQQTGYQMMPYWRPPYGDIDASVLRDVYAGGYYVTVMWSCDTLGWSGLSEQQILNRCMYPSGAGSIILMHLSADSLDWAATDNLLQYFQDQGLQIVTVEQLLGG